MKDSRKIQYNLTIGIAAQLAAVVLGILVPRLVMVHYGSEVNGLVTSVNNIYSYASLMEAGVAAASCQALYQPLAGGDRKRISGILAEAGRRYRKTGLAYLGMILVFSLGYPTVVRSGIPPATVFLVVLFSGLGHVPVYFFHGKYLMLLKADGRNYVRTGTEAVTVGVKQLAKILLISMGFDVVTVQFASMVTDFAQTLYLAGYIRRHYHWLDRTAKPERNGIRQSGNALIHEINYMITSNVDVVLLTLVGDLKTVSVYSLYAMLMSMGNRALRTVKDAFEFKLAELFHRGREEFQDHFSSYETGFAVLAFWMFTVIQRFLQPFLALYTRGVEDADYLMPGLPVLFVLVQLVLAARYPVDAVVHIAGHFRQTQKSAAAETVLNLAMSLVLVSRCGIQGVLVGTILSALWRTGWMIRYVNRNILGRSTAKSWKCWGLQFGIWLAMSAANRILPREMGSYPELLLHGVFYGAAAGAVYGGLNLLIRPRECSRLIRAWKRLMERR